MDDLTIRGFESLAGINERGVVTPGRQVESQGFVELLKGAIDNVNQIQHESGRLQDAVARGENMNIHQAIIAGEKVDEIIEEDDPKKGHLATENIDAHAEKYMGTRPYPLRNPKGEVRVLFKLRPTKILTFGPIEG